GRLRASELVLLALAAARLPDAKVVVNDAPADLDGPLAAYCEARRHLAELWPVARDPVSKLLLESVALKRNIYSDKLCQRLVPAVDALVAVREGSIAGYTKDIVKLASSSLEDAVRAGHPAPKHMAFGVAERLLQARLALEAALEHWAQSVEGRLAPPVRAGLPKRRRGRATPSLACARAGFP